MGSWNCSELGWYVGISTTWPGSDGEGNGVRKDIFSILMLLDFLPDPAVKRRVRDIFKVIGTV